MAAKMQTRRPSAKVTAATVGAAGAGLVAWALNTFLLGPEQQIGPGEVSMLTTLLVLVAGYVVPPSKGDCAEEREAPGGAREAGGNDDAEV